MFTRPVEIEFAERSRNFNVGAVWSPDGDTSIGLDWYRIEQDNLVKPDSAGWQD